MTFDYAALEAAGIEQVVVTYYGEGDEGSIDEITPEPFQVEYGSAIYDMIENAAIDLLEHEYPGWEINEGSRGHVTINVAERKMFLHHGTNVITTAYTDREFS